MSNILKKKFKKKKKKNDKPKPLLSIDVEGLGGYLSAIVLLPLALGMLGKGLLKFSIGGAAAAASTAPELIAAAA